VCRVQNRFGWHEAEARLTVHGQLSACTFHIVVQCGRVRVLIRKEISTFLILS